MQGGCSVNGVPLVKSAPCMKPGINIVLPACPLSLGCLAPHLLPWFRDLSSLLFSLPVMSSFSEWFCPLAPQSGLLGETPMSRLVAHSLLCGPGGMGGAEQHSVLKAVPFLSAG